MLGKRPAPGKFRVLELSWTWVAEGTSADYAVENNMKTPVIIDENPIIIAEVSARLSMNKWMNKYNATKVIKLCTKKKALRAILMQHDIYVAANVSSFQTDSITK